MRWILTGILATTVMLAQASMAYGEFYYSSGNQIPLTVDTLKAVIKFDEGPSQSSVDDLMLAFARIVGATDDPLIADGFVACSLSTGQGYYAFLDSIQAVEGVYLVEPYYLMADSSEFVVCGRFCVAFDSSLTVAQIDGINDFYHVAIIEEMLGMHNVYVLKNTDRSGYRTLDLANLYYDLPQTRYAHPDFRSYLHLSGYMLYDHYHQFQPQIKKVIGTFNDVTVWDFAAIDRSVTVGLIDDGVDEHEDLPIERILWWEGYNFCDTVGTALPKYYEWHGMACAGILAASHTADSIEGQSTTSGVISMNPHITILPVKIYCDTAINEPTNFAGWCSMIATAITWTWMEGAELLSCSWGWPNPDRDSDVLNEAISNAFLLGRSGRGCPVVFAAGNYAALMNYGNVQYPARLPTAFAVGALKLDDNAYEFSQHGPDLDIMAPSGNGTTLEPVWSIDQMGLAGHNPQYWSECPPDANDPDYQCRFGHTSAACPIVAGAASLLLARDSMLTSQQVYDILRYSAVTELDNGVTVTPPDTLYGYGRVDAFRAMLAITRGDANNDGVVNNSDQVYIVDWVFKGGPDPKPDVRTADANCDGLLNIGDAVYVMNYVFKSGPEPPICFEYAY